MCSPLAVLAGVGTGAKIAGEYTSQRAMAENAEATMNAQAKTVNKNMNFAFQNYEIERDDAFDSAVNELIKTKQNSMQLNSAVKASVLENVSGNTARLLIRNAEGDTAKATSSIKDNYQQKSNEIDLNKETTLNNAKSQIDAINLSAPKMPSRFANFLTTAGYAIDGYTTAENIDTKRKLGAKGVKYSYGKW